MDQQHRALRLCNARLLPIMWMDGFANWGRTVAILITVLLGARAALAQIPSQKPISRTSVCATSGCHTSVLDHPNLHAPVAKKQCLSCHEYNEPAEHTFTLKEASAGDLCISCHGDMASAVTHDPVANKECLNCHDAHGSDQPALLIADPARDLCATCHAKDYEDKDFVHGPVAVGACIVCHDPHSSPKEALLTKSPPDLCVDCHSALVAPADLPPGNIHAPAREDCTTCHDPHASNHRYQLKDDPPQLCFSCHTEFKDWLESAGTKHGPVTDANGCTQCHTPHFSAIPHLQKESQPDLCLRCHNKPLDDHNGKKLVNMQALLANNPDRHGPIRDGSCTACHQPHAENNFRLLHDAYPPEFYAPFAMERYQLCFSCHQPDLVKDKSGTGLTNFRNGDRNLHFVHVNREKGRTCRACHDVHASKKPFHIREAVPFGKGGWMLPINYEKSANGGSCSPGCHRTRSYDRTAANAIGAEKTDASVNKEP